ncbi:MAG: hypothetical protein GYA55_14745, partial [SAR324 cluster bacterium]|nr:hypothetical protein [SAR324 cluster bacterium]
MDAMILSPDLESRTRLRELLSEASGFGVIKIMSTLTEGLQRLFAGEHYGSFFIASLFGYDVVREFIRKSKETKAGCDAAYVMT